MNTWRKGSFNNAHAINNINYVPPNPSKRGILWILRKNVT